MSQNSEQCCRCLYTCDHPLGLTLDSAGICSGCRVHEEKDRLDWDDRWKRLEALVEPYRGSEGYDCIVPVTGANDSYYIVHLVKERLGLNPLLVSYNKYYNTPLGIRNLANLRIRFDCDILVQNVNPRSVRSVTRASLRDLGSVYWHILAGQSVFPVQTAVKNRIPLIIWGAHQGLEQVGMYSHTHEVEMTRRYRKDHDLMATEADQLITLFDTVRPRDVYQYMYPEDDLLQEGSVRGIYLGNFVRWDPKTQHEQMVERYNYLGAPFPRTFDTFDHADCYVYMGLHDLLKLYKHGYSKVTDHACREIRFGRLTREQGVELVRRHRFQPAPFLNLFEEWLGMTPTGLAFMLDQHRSSRYWQQDGSRQWHFNDPLAGLGGEESDIFFAADSALSFDKSNDQFITIGKGYP